MKYSLPIGILLGGGAVLLAQPTLRAPDHCGVERVKHDVSTAYVLKAPDAPQCAPVEAPAPIACPEAKNPTPTLDDGINSAEVSSLGKNKRTHRHRRRWRH